MRMSKPAVLALFLLNGAIAAAGALEAPTPRDSALIARYAQDILERQMPRTLDALLQAQADLEEARDRLEGAPSQAMRRWAVAVSQVSERWVLQETILGESFDAPHGSIHSVALAEIGVNGEPAIERSVLTRKLRVRAMEGAADIDIAGRTLRNGSRVPVEHARVTLVLGDDNGLTCETDGAATGMAAIAPGGRSPLRCKPASEAERMSAFKALWETQPRVQFPRFVVRSLRFAPAHYEATWSSGHFALDRAAAGARLQSALLAAPRWEVADTKTEARRASDSLLRLVLVGDDPSWWVFYLGMEGLVLGTALGWVVGFVLRRPVFAIGMCMLGTVALALLLGGAFAFLTLMGKGALEPGLAGILAMILTFGAFSIGATVLGNFLLGAIAGAVIGAWMKRRWRRGAPLLNQGQTPVS
jgi:hypothetical protein